MKALTLGGAPTKHFNVLAGVVRRTSPVRHLEMRYDPVDQVGKTQHRALLTVLGHV